MRFRSRLLLALGVATAIGLLRRRGHGGFVDVHFDDGSTIRLTRGPEARDLLGDASAVLEVAS